MDSNHGMGEFQELDLVISDWDDASLDPGDGIIIGKTRLDSQFAHTLQDRVDDPESYGSALFEALMPDGGPLITSYRQEILRARERERRIRLRITLASTVPQPVHEFRWEFLYDPVEASFLARSRETALSRYVSGKEWTTPVVGRPRLLVAVAAPEDIQKFGMADIDRPMMYRQLHRALEPLADHLDWEFLKPPITLNRLADRLHARDIHGLHLVGHGYIDKQRRASALVLENSVSNCDHVEEQDLSELFLGERTLRLLTLMTCEGAVHSASSPMSGLGRRLVDRGLPAVIAMQDTVTFSTAEEFSQFFYRGLARHGLIDVAANEARHMLFLSKRRSRRWSDPVLYMHLKHGALWDFEPNSGRHIPRTTNGTPDDVLAQHGVVPVSVLASVGEDRLVNRGNEWKGGDAPMTQKSTSRRALLIGLEKLDSERRLICSGNDARTMARMLETHEDGSPNFERTVLTSGPDGEVSTSDLCETVRHTLQSDATEVLLFFSGYGAFAGANGVFFSETGGPEEPGLFIDQLMTMAQGSTARIVVIFDCCEPTMAASVHEMLVGRPGFSLDSDMTIFGSVRDSRPGSEGKKTSFFTESVLSALDGGAGDLLGHVTTAAAFSYSEQFKKDSQRFSFATRSARFMTLRRCLSTLKPELLGDLRRIFPTAESVFRMDPSFEYSRDEAVSENVEIFDVFKKLRNLGLLTTEGQEDLYFVALESRHVWLTTTGRLYWRLAGMQVEAS